MLNHVLMPDTQAILLLCASFGQSRQVEPRPLELREYNQLASWLKENQMRPGDLLNVIDRDRLQEMQGLKLEYDRLVALLERGGMLAIATEKWINKGLWILGRSDAQYPKRLKQKLKHKAPAILYGIGNIELLSARGLAIVGSRDADAEALSYTQQVAQTCAQQGIQVVSGGARGVDEAAMLEAIDFGGTALGVLADSLTKSSVAGKYRSGIREGRLALISACDPDAGFNKGNLMGRNKYIYAFADCSLVVSSSFNNGGTWSGAIEALKDIDVPVFVRIGERIPEGNRKLIELGAKPFPAQPWHDLSPLLTLKIENKAKIVETPTTDSQSDKAKIVEIPTTDSQPDVDAITSYDRSYPKDIYEAVIPLILEKLEQLSDAKSLATCLDVRIGQLQDWLKRGVDEGKVLKTKNGYIVNRDGSQLSLLDKIEELD